MTLRLASMAIDYWTELDGFAVSQNMPPLTELPLSRFCNFVHWYATRDAEEADRLKFRIKLWRPPPNSTAPIPSSSPWSAASETAAFAALKAGLGS